LIARIAVLAMIFSLMAVALPASATSVAIDTTGPCPTATPSAGFTDIGAFDATTQTAINCLFAFGITTGTSATTYSPNDTITRWQMALFLIRQAADHGITIPTAVNQGYTDIGGFDTATQNAINQITQLGISKGTSTTTFSPNAGVTRWQMALFIYRTGLAAGVTFTNNAAHNEFVDIGGLSTEAQTAINALTDTRPDPEGHIALGIGGSLFAPDLILVRWQMALFLTRLLAADNIAAPAGVRVTVTPTDAVTLAAGNARAFTATFKNLDGTPYTGRVGITVKAFASSAVQYDDVPANTSILETVSDSLVVVGDTATGFPGTNGIVTFLVRHVGGTETVVPVAWEDLDADGTPEITGNTAPTEPFGLGGQTTFSAPAPEAADGEVMNELVTSTSPSTDSFVADDIPSAVLNTFNYDSGDLFLIGGVPSDLASFEAALTVGDTVGGVYRAAAGDQSTFDITNDIDPPVTVTNPAAATSTTNTTFTITGTGTPGYLVSIYNDADNGTDIDGGADFKQAEVTVAGDGTWSANVNLTLGVANNFTANQRAVAGDPNGAAVDVPTITQGAAAATNFTLTDLTTSAGVATTLDPGDVLTVTFSGDVTGVGSGDTWTVVDIDGSTSTIICGTHATCAEGAAGVVTVTIDNVLATSGGTTGGINVTASVTGVTGFTAADGSAIALTGDRTFEMP
jgi:hypothetical protein